MTKTPNDKIIGRPIRLNRIRLTVVRQKDYAKVVYLGDVHFGSPQCDLPRFLAMVDYCVKNNVYVLLMGDMLEMATRTSIGAGIYHQTIGADEQFEQMVEWLKPLADKKLILGAHLGNHEERILKESGFNVTKAMCRELKCRYLGDACWSQFLVGSQIYNQYSLHGRTGSRFEGTALLNLERISTSFNADLIACGHSHKLITSSVLIQRVVNGSVREFKKHLLITGGYLSYDGGYAQTIGLPMSKKGSPAVRFYAKRHDLYITW